MALTSIQTLNISNNNHIHTATNTKQHQPTHCVGTAMKEDVSNIRIGDMMITRKDTTKKANASEHCNPLRPS